MMTGLRGRDLEKWITAADASGLPELRSFVTGLRRDQDAVTAGLTLHWSSGAVEGHVNRFKDDQTTDVRTRQPRPAQPARPARRLTTRSVVRRLAGRAYGFAELAECAF
jgi:hypothetical protein